MTVTFYIDRNKTTKQKLIEMLGAEKVNDLFDEALDSYFAELYGRSQWNIDGHIVEILITE